MVESVTLYTSLFTYSIQVYKVLCIVYSTNLGLHIMDLAMNVLFKRCAIICVYTETFHVLLYW